MKLFKCVCWELAASGKVESLEVPEIPEYVDAGELDAVNKVESLEVFEVLESIDVGQLSTAVNSSAQYSDSFIAFPPR